MYAMHDVFGCPGWAYLFQLSNVHQKNDRALRFSDGAFTEAKKLAKWSGPPAIPVRTRQMPVMVSHVPDSAWLLLVGLEPGSAAQANPEGTDP